MDNFKKYRRSQIAELRPVNKLDIRKFQQRGCLLVNGDTVVSISQVDEENGSPNIGDMIARNPKNHEDQWLVAEKYFNDNFERTEDE